MKPKPLKDLKKTIQENDTENKEIVPDLIIIDDRPFSPETLKKVKKGLKDSEEGKIKIRNIKRVEKTYKIAWSRYEQLKTEQDNKCFICLAPPKSKALCIDHNHKTGEVRGLLCFRCNKFLVGCLERMHKKPREVLVRLNEYFNKYRMKNDL